jgi:hypothetical protein
MHKVKNTRKYMAILLFLDDLNQLMSTVAFPCLLHGRALYTAK